MSVTTDPLPPVPEHTPPLKENETQQDRGKYFNQAWTRWFVSLRDKVNVINSSLVNLGDVTGSGIIVKSGASWLARIITGTANRISVTNGSGVSADPVIDVETANLIAGTNISFIGSGVDRIIDNGAGDLTINASGGGGGGGGGGLIYGYELPATETGWDGVSLRVRVPMTMIPQASGLIITIQGPNVGSTNIGEMYVQEAAATGNAWDFSTTPIQCFFAGSPTVTIATNAFAKTDVVSIPISGFKALIISVYFTGTTAIRVLNIAPFSSYYVLATNSAAAVAPSGYTTQTGRLNLAMKLSTG